MYRCGIVACCVAGIYLILFELYPSPVRRGRDTIMKKRNQFFSAAWAASACACVMSAPLATSLDAADKPNIIVMITDDLNYEAYSYTGNENLKTPHVDKLIEDGVFFRQAYTTHAVCAPSRAGLMTGRYQARFGYETLTGNTEEAKKFDRGVDTKEVFISNILKDAGYTTAAIGKWHLGVNEKYQPNARGFDYAFNFLGGCSYDRWDGLRENGKPVDGSGYTTDALTDRTLSFIEENKDKPFFIYYASFNVHSPYTVDPKYLPEGATVNKVRKPKEVSGEYDDLQKAYDGMITAFDVQVGRINNKLEELGLAENTIVVITNDNGGTKIRPCKQFSGHKATYYEGGVRTPFAIKWPAQLKAGTVDKDNVISNLDLLPTLVAAAGGKLPTDRDIDGVNILPVLKGESKIADDRQLFWRAGSGSFTRKGKYKLHWPLNRKKHAEAYLKLKGKKQGREDPPLYDPANYDAPLLFDLSVDEKEQNDIAAQHPEIVQQLCKDLERFNTFKETDKIQGSGK